LHPAVPPSIARHQFALEVWPLKEP